MSQVITNAFEQYWQSCLAAEKPVVLDEFILADIPNLDITSPIDPETGLPPESQIVHRQNVDQRGRINNNAVAYTIVMETTVGDFSFNAMYLRNKLSGVIGMIVYKGRETKLKTDQSTGQTGNSLVKSMLMGYDQAAEATLTHVDAGTWQIDYAARLRGMDEDLRQLASQLYGHHTFIGDGFKVVEKDGAYQVTKGVAIVGGLRVELKAPEVIHPGTKPIGVWVDVHRAGSLLSEHQNHFTIITSVADLADHVDSNGYQHYVAKLGVLDNQGEVTDSREVIQNSGNLGETRHLWARSLAEAGYHLVDGSFESGAFIAKRNDAVLFESNGKCFVWADEFPSNGIVIPKKSTPESTGGASWRYVDNSLRGELFAGPIVERDGAAALRDFISIHEFGVVFDNVTDNAAALTAAFTSGKKIWIPHPGPGNYASVDGPVYFDDGVEVQGPGKWVEVIRASAKFPHNVDVVSPLKLSKGDATPTRYFSFRDFLVNANGWVRSIGVEDSCSGVVFAACEEYEASNVVSKNSPKWNFRFAPFNSYADLGHLGQHTSPNKLGRVWGLHSEDFLDGDGFIAEGTEHLKGYGCTHTTTAKARLLKTYTKTHTGFQVVEGSKHVIFEKSFVDGGGSQMTAYGGGAHANRPAVYDVLFKDSDAKGVNRLFAVWSDPETDISFYDPRWACREIRAENCKLTHPVVDPTSATLPARVVDLQYVKESHSKGVGVVFTGEPDESPVAIINFGPGVNCSVDGFTAKGVPGIPSNSYAVERNCGWVRSSETTTYHSSGLVVRNIALDNIGYVNRVVHDSGEKSFVEIDGIAVDAIPSDGQEKVGVVSGSLKIDVKRVKGPAGFVKYKLGRSFSSFPYDDVSIRSADVSQIDTVIGGMRIRSETNAGVQPVPGIIFDRQFVSANDPVGANGKGSICFRTSAAAEGRLSITAYHEDVNEFRPIALFQSTDSVKAFAPVQDNVMSVGVPSARASIGYFAQGVQTTSDARLKSEVRPMTPQELSAASAISKTIGIFTWLSDESDRLHCGTTVQTVIKCMQDAGLNAFDYGFVCHDEWDDEYIEVTEFVDDGDGNVSEIPTGQKIVAKPAGDVYTLRDHELYKFLVRGLAHRLSLIEESLPAVS